MLAEVESLAGLSEWKSFKFLDTVTYRFSFLSFLKEFFNIWGSKFRVEELVL